MSEPGPESIPTSADPRSRRPVKKRALTPVSKQAASVEALFAHPEKPIHLPSGGGGPHNKKELAPPPEIVTNVQGSSAGAGSGEFHVYKASRRREYERIRLMEEEVEQEKKEHEWESKREEAKQKDERKSSKNKAKRDKAKARKEKAKTAPVESSGNDKMEKKKNVLNKIANARPQAAQDSTTHENNDHVKVVDEIGIIIHDDD